MKMLRAILRPFGILGLIVFVCGAIGCQANHTRAAAKAPPEKAQPTGPVPTQFGPAPAKLTRVNTDLRFVVLDFSSRAMPPLGTKLTVFRDGQSVGLVQITEPVRGRFATADILDGDLLVGDEAH
jgi:hypothetical protein